MNTRSVDLKRWIKHSHAPKRKVFSSKSFHDNLDVMQFVDINEGVDPYSAWRDSHNDGDSHNDVCEHVHGWVCDVLGLSSEEDEDCVYVNKPIPTRYQANSQLSTPRKSPDVTYCVADFLFVQIEVLSGGDRDDTVFKLALGLIDQNRFEKNQGLQVPESTGFYFPVGDTGVIEKSDLQVV